MSDMPSLSGLSLRDLDYAVAVARHGHFGRAAEQCGVSQPGLSEQIRKLESLLGCTLFERGRRGARLTTRGAALMPAIETLVRDGRALLEQARSAGDGLGASLSLGIIPTLGPYYMPGLLRVLRTDYPDIALRLTEEKTDVLTSDLLDHRLDIMIVALVENAPGLVCVPLFFEPFRLLVPADDPLSMATAVTAEDLARPDLLLLDSGHCLREQTLSLCRPSASDGRSPRLGASLEMLRHMVAAGEGVAVMPALAVDGPRDDTPLTRSVAFDDRAAGRVIAACWRRGDPRTHHFETISHLLRRSVASPLVPP
ncbi:oxidative stress regulatory protein OxyR [Ameyamaea chiangmaiensis NBRC 103196]|uniref:Hydrogen peroxide-inducible genes activator n=1 Tax=Ameyamaea chiangmaiensis TaxID=442969 RepID=A0A850PH44_9PROT|nr:hydrogen peroxide-inducible genes activator [Ameyamaea chiangmaiensis]MBS4074306.1 hydrogen peroxide-inducible genes activator [Ameyamaea chiangmaiensis]NVN41182.1 hydrogen peroxide-inducible genes activator [Ameyamaea chiangmaiensis]GBQ71587.1 oxidative stress regulatory protein OxyR [Ameyamaea chiangmaiensis NBRC 103196]